MFELLALGVEERLDVEGVEGEEEDVTTLVEIARVSVYVVGMDLVEIELDRREKGRLEEGSLSLSLVESAADVENFACRK